MAAADFTLFQYQLHRCRRVQCPLCSSEVQRVMLAGLMPEARQVSRPGLCSGAGAQEWVTIFDYGQNGQRQLRCRHFR